MHVCPYPVTNEEAPSIHTSIAGDMAGSIETQESTESSATCYEVAGLPPLGIFPAGYSAKGNFTRSTSFLLCILIDFGIGLALDRLLMTLTRTLCGASSTASIFRDCDPDSLACRICGCACVVAKHARPVD